MPRIDPKNLGLPAPKPSDDPLYRYWGQSAGQPAIEDIPVEPPTRQERPRPIPTDPQPSGGQSWFGGVQKKVAYPFLQNASPLPQARPRDDPERMFSPEQNLARNKRWAKPGPYITKLTPEEEREFRAWAIDQHRQGRLMEPEQYFQTENTPYDLRGFWKAEKAGDPRATAEINPYDKQWHRPDVWKTPYEATFSDESIYAIPGKTPRWVGDNSYQLPNGHVIFDDRSGRWYGLPNEPVIRQPPRRER